MGAVVNNDDAGKKTIGDLLVVMAALRTPVTGCAWDLEQDFASIAPYTLEEAYEVADAIERGDLVDLREELGDLLLQVVYHARMAEEAGAFDFHDVTDGITRKMLRRHPHVFGTPAERAVGLQKGAWDRIKAAEKVEKAAAKGDDANGETGGLLADVPLPLPALLRAVKLQSKAAKVGFDWPSLKPVFDKMREELAELEEVALPHDPRGEGEASQEQLPERVREEFGDLLFVMANVARHLNVDPEDALRAANEKFSRRFRYIEQRLAERGKSPSSSDLIEMDALWDEAKDQERKPTTG
ncbi:Nucleoside triphosphate pyrophosphohydrolase [Candidatus Filomicrobium marinum]|uniref:Nucleoside triphosphate pyrophosphohydrolase n=1 Tax=Candidatus Filomicrobium marinum TaxID=1608628 RepID=A0A0D6JIZ5_9HYPH|nr:Nucleoside triphosphate pyrophosphohydrolase [Candidatus Filomicrobium marinum]